MQFHDTATHTRLILALFYIRLSLLIELAIWRQRRERDICLNVKRPYFCQNQLAVLYSPAQFYVTLNLNAIPKF